MRRPELLKRRIDFGQPDNKGRLYRFVAPLEGEYVVTFKPVRPARSLDQQGYYRGVIVPLYFDLLKSEDEEITNEEQAHKCLAAEFLTVTKRTKAGRLLTWVRSTSDLDVGEFWEFVEQCIVKLTRNGVVVPPPSRDPKERAEFRRRKAKVPA